MTHSQSQEAFVEADSYTGPSIVIAYCPCIAHGIRAGMSHTIVEEKLAVKAGYWTLYRYNPENKKIGKEVLTVDYAKPDDSMVSFLAGEDRYADLKIRDDKMVDVLWRELQDKCDDLYNIMIYETKSPCN